MTPLNDWLEKTFSIRLIRSVKFRKDQPINLVYKTGIRFAHFVHLYTSIGNVPGNVVECGVGWGRSLLTFSTLSTALEDGRKIIGYDSFAGFPKPSNDDEPERTGVVEGRYDTSEDVVMRFLENSGLPTVFLEQQLKLVAGFFEDTVPNYDEGPIALLHLDCDLHDSYKTALGGLYDHVSPGGIIAFDEYQANPTYPGARKAINAFFGEDSSKIIKSPYTNRHYFVKE